MLLENIYFTETDMEAQLKTIVDFLAKVHPELTNSSFQNSCVELRPINRSNEFNIRLNRSLNLWRLDKNSIDRIRDYLFKHNGQPYCMYYSVFAFDYQKDAYTKKGKKAIKGKITDDSALMAHELVLDFDKITYIEFKGLVSRLAELGIEGLWVFTGHGYQLHILLEEPIYNDGELYRLVYLFRAKGFMCDTACVDSARLMRLPFTYNCKCFANEEYDDEFNNPPLCKIVKETDKRFVVAEIVAKLVTLPTENEQDEIFYQKGYPQTTLETVAVDNKATDKADISDMVDTMDMDEGDNIALQRLEYPAYLQMDDLPEPIVKMLKHTPMGYRNSALGLMIKYFKQYLLFGKEQIYNILSIWAEYACEPAYNRMDFIKDFDRLYQGGGLNFSSELARKFGYINFENLIQLHRDNKVFISNTVFQNMPVIDGNVLRAYLGVKVLEHGNTTDDEFNIPVTISAIADITGMSIPTLKRVLPVAKSMKLLYVKQGAKRKGESNTYHCNRITDTEAGFKALSVNDLDVYLSQSARLKLSNSELKLYMFMLYKFYTKDWAMSLKKLGQAIGCAESSVSALVTALQKKRYIRVEKMYKDKVVYFNKYTLLK